MAENDSDFLDDTGYDEWDDYNAEDEDGFWAYIDDEDEDESDYYEDDE